MNKAVWILLGIILIAVGVFLAVPQGGINWSEELVDFLKGGIIIVLILAGLFAFLMAKLE